MSKSARRSSRPSRQPGRKFFTVARHCPHDQEEKKETKQTKKKSTKNCRNTSVSPSPETTLEEMSREITAPLRRKIIWSIPSPFTEGLHLGRYPHGQASLLRWYVKDLGLSSQMALNSSSARYSRRGLVHIVSLLWALVSLVLKSG